MTHLPARSESRGRSATVLTPELRDDMLRAVSSLRAFAISLTGSVDQADDLVQEALVRGLSNLNRFEAGTNIQAWLFTILRNQFHTAYRKRRREVEDPDGSMAGNLCSAPEQDGHLDLEDLKAALARLPFEQREALLLVSAEGFSYEEAARICGTGLGTIKSRVNRARTRLAEMLGIEEASDIGADRVIKAAVQAQAWQGAAG
jgi:RNA polymerase sigma-70 factor, ECF subfamily